VLGVRLWLGVWLGVTLVLGNWLGVALDVGVSVRVCECEADAE
jgi:hypothetical protein